MNGPAHECATAISSARRIARNTLVLYFRQILILAVNLYTVRVVLATLGTQDYGIYNVVAGVVALFSFVNNAMTTATQRFLNFNLGRKDSEKTRQTFSESLLIHGGISIVFVILAETAGLWFVDFQLNIPAERHSAMMWVYQMSVITTVFSILRVPYNAVIIAYERMSFFAWMSIIESVLKLVVASLMVASPMDKLLTYASLQGSVSLIILLCHKLYCRQNFSVARYTRQNDRKSMLEMIRFSGWSLWGATANACTQQGTNIVLNLFTNVTVNAAMGIASQVNGAVYSFVGNFQTAFNPQLVKSYAAGETGRFENLVVRSAKFSFYLLTLLVVPLFINCEYVLELWLGTVPEHGVNFVRLILVWSLVDSLNGPLWMSIQATGNIRRYQVIVSTLIFANLPASIVALGTGCPPESILMIRIVLAMITTIWRVFFLGGRVNLPMKRFFLEVLCRSTCVLLIGFSATSLVVREPSDAGGLISSCLVSLLVNLTAIYLIGMTRTERHLMYGLVCMRPGK